MSPETISGNVIERQALALNEALRCKERENMKGKRQSGALITHLFLSLSFPLSPSLSVCLRMPSEML